MNITSLSDTYTRHIAGGIPRHFQLINFAPEPGRLHGGSIRLLSQLASEWVIENLSGRWALVADDKSILIGFELHDEALLFSLAMSAEFT